MQCHLRLGVARRARFAAAATGAGRSSCGDRLLEYVIHRHHHRHPQPPTHFHEHFAHAPFGRHLPLPSVHTGTRSDSRVVSSWGGPVGGRGEVVGATGGHACTGSPQPSPGGSYRPACSRLNLWHGAGRASSRTCHCTYDQITPTTTAQTPPQRTHTCTHTIHPPPLHLLSGWLTCTRTSGPWSPGCGPFA